MCVKMEEAAKVDKKKSKKERQKNSKKVCEEQNSQELNVKLEPIDEEDTNKVISEVNTFNKFNTLANMSDASETKHDSCAIAERRLVNTLSVSKNSCIDIFPEDKINAAAQTVNLSGVFPSQCFYCA